MMRLCGVLLTAMALMALAADDKKDDAVKEEMKKLQGTWQLVASERDGQKLPAETAKMAKAVVKDDKVTISLGDNVLAEGTLTIDPTKKPKQIESLGTSGNSKGKKSIGIYDLDSDTLKICLTEGNERPKEFSAKKGSGCEFYEYKREKK